MKTGQWFKSLGPGLITVSVVIGPGSIITANKAGGHFGYHLIWLLVFAAFLMVSYVLMAARVGCRSDRSILQLAAELYGRPVAVLTGISCFLVAAGFQFGNNLGVATALEGVTGIDDIWWPVIVTVITITGFFALGNLYHKLEKGMKVLVGIIVLAFIANLITTGIDLGGFFRGFVPSLPENSLGIATAMLATNFSVVAALYQAHLVKEKRWKGTDSAKIKKDAIFGVSILCMINVVILCGAAGAFREQPDIELNSAADLAGLFEALLGKFSKIIFCLGLFAAAFSSFVVNALIGGGLLADGLGLDARLDGRPAKLCTTLAMVVGSGVAMLALFMNAKPVPSIIIAQASTLLAVPICAILLLFIANNRRVMGDQRNGIWLNLLGSVGLLFLLYKGWGTMQNLWGKIFS